MNLTSGPAPKRPEERARRNKPSTANMELPAEGRQKPTPPWPTDALPSPVAWARWEELWRLPQAVAWEHMRVPPYVVAMVADLRTRDKLSNNEMMEARQIEDRLGLNPMAMRRLGWEVKTPDIQPERVASPRARYEGLRAVTAEDSGKA